jgi:hypothetical protein
MAFKTYVPGLILILRTAHRYATRYQAHLSGTLTTEQYACLLDLIAAMASCLAALGTPEIVP